MDLAELSVEQLKELKRDLNTVLKERKSLEAEEPKGHERVKPVSRSQKYWDLFGPELYDDATKPQGKLTRGQLIAKYETQLDNEERLTPYMISTLIALGKRLEGITV